MTNYTKKILLIVLLAFFAMVVISALVIVFSDGDDSSTPSGSSGGAVGISLVVLFIILQREKLYKTAVRHIQKRKKKGVKVKMKDFIMDYVGKECLIYTINGQYEGTVRSASEGAVQLQTKTGLEILNLDYVVRVREYPKNKNGKKKSVVLD